MATHEKKSVLFICLGNICRSPIAEAVFLDLLKKKGDLANWHVDSGALGDWHVGKGPYHRTMKTLKKFGITDYHHKARLVKTEDFNKFDYIFGMDNANLEGLEELKPGKEYKAKIQLLGEYDPEKELIIVDPYFDDKDEDFEYVFQQCKRCCESFLEFSTKDVKAS
ncbi:hypothetical protein ScPMuIL_016666 [Solemya velum]